ncbi:hypothetical protein KYK30_31260 [Shinella yambaruensis]|uniref:Uncharacterized protein n=1 Tax=Shinella yambaruensis TaxID=415996 RepID=A0ABQ5ZSV1_9HYPH|nr:hypothetical protein [Shinella yambaruensis]MCJ8029957.1 hypothetical protein [Shinella yambaruensis]MCU7984202.1 hypothetical protein [Shinella yambaruensis]GLR55206.1 hypothetical protein GCM10007923_64280 [Shinella yambaruensis]
MGKIITIQAAMFAALGEKTKLSRSGLSVIFIEPQCGRHDLSGIEDLAVKQAEAAGLDINAVTQEQVAAYTEWWERVSYERQIGQARIRVTRIYPVQCGHSEIPGNRVDLLDGWGRSVESRFVHAKEIYDPDAINRIGGKGAYCHIPDAAGLDRAIVALRKRHPEYSGAPVKDNNLSQAAG